MFRQAIQFIRNFCGKRPASKKRKIRGNLSIDYCVAFLTANFLLAMSQAASVSFRTKKGFNSFVASSDESFFMQALSQLKYQSHCDIEFINLEGSKDLLINACSGLIRITSLNNSNPILSDLLCVVRHFDNYCEERNNLIKWLTLASLITVALLLKLAYDKRAYSSTQFRYQALKNRISQLHPTSADEKAVISSTREILELTKNSFTDQANGNIMQNPITHPSGVTVERRVAFLKTDVTVKSLIDNSLNFCEKTLKNSEDKKGQGCTQPRFGTR